MHGIGVQCTLRFYTTMQSAEVQQGESQHFVVVGIAWLINASS